MQKPQLFLHQVNNWPPCELHILSLSVFFLLFFYGKNEFQLNGDFLVVFFRGRASDF